VSIESLSSLRQLIEVMSQGQGIQLENLQGVQKAVQQISSSEAQRKDNVHLEKAKAVYDTEILQASKEKLDGKLQRQKFSEQVLAVTTAVVATLTVGDAAWNTVKDVSGLSMLNGNTSKGKIGNFDKGSTRLSEMSHSGKADSDIFISDKNGNVAGFTREGTGSIRNNDVKVGKIAENDVQSFIKGNGAFSLVSSDGKATQRARALGLVSTSEDGKTDVTEKGKKLGLSIKTDGTLDVSKIKDFNSLFKVDQEGAKNLFDTKSHSIGRNETSSLLSAISNVGGVDKSVVKDALKTSGKGGTTLDNVGSAVGRGGKSLYNGLIAMADATMPLFDAFMEMKSRVQSTQDELKAVEDKLAAASKRLRKLQEIILNPGGSGLGNEFSGENKAKAG